MKEKISAFLIFCSGGDREILKKASFISERDKYAMIGLAVWLTSVFAFISGSYALTRVFHDDAYGIPASLALGALWGLIIFNLDRFIVSSIQKSGPWWKPWVQAVPRILLAILISFVVVMPLEVALFQDVINAHINKMKLREYEGVVVQIEEINRLGNLNEEVNRLEADLERIADRKNEDPKTEKFRSLQYDARACEVGFEELRRNNTAAINLTKEKRDEVQAQINKIVNDPASMYVNDDGEEERRPEAQDRINQLTVQRSAHVRQIQTLDRQIGDKRSECDLLMADVQRERSRYRSMLDSTLAVVDARRGQKMQALARADSLSALQKGEAEDALEQGYSQNFIRQVEALWDLSGVWFSIMWWVKYLIMGIFILVDIAPLVVKLMTETGAYEAEREKQRRAREARDIVLLKHAEQYGEKIIAEAFAARSRVSMQLIKDWEASQKKRKVPAAMSSPVGIGAISPAAAQQPAPVSGNVSPAASFLLPVPALPSNGQMPPGSSSPGSVGTSKGGGAI